MMSKIGGIMKSGKAKNTEAKLTKNVVRGESVTWKSSSEFVNDFNAFIDGELKQAADEAVKELNAMREVGGD